MDPATWGPHVWKSIHAIAAHTDATNNATAFKAYMTALADALPCSACQKHMKDYIATNPLPDTNCFEYTVEFHNAVNKRLGKPDFTPERAREDWARCNSGCEPISESNPVVLYVIIALSAIIIGLVLMKHAVR